MIGQQNYDMPKATCRRLKCGDLRRKEPEAVRLFSGAYVDFSQNNQSPGTVYRQVAGLDIAFQLFSWERKP